MPLSFDVKIPIMGMNGYVLPQKEEYPHTFVGLLFALFAVPSKLPERSFL
jgi:hypothetical protein